MNETFLTLSFSSSCDTSGATSLRGSSVLSPSSSPFLLVSQPLHYVAHATHASVHVRVVQRLNAGYANCCARCNSNNAMSLRTPVISCTCRWDEMLRANMIRDAYDSQNGAPRARVQRNPSIIYIVRISKACLFFFYVFYKWVNSLLDSLKNYATNMCLELFYLLINNTYVIK